MGGMGFLMDWHDLRIVVDGDEVSGFLVYGLGPRHRFAEDARLDLAPGLGEGELSLLIGERWEVLIRGVSIDIWPSPDAWTTAIERCLRGMLNLGAVVAWIGAEGLPFVDPPDLFDEGQMAGGVLAWASADGGRGGDVPLDRTLKPVDNDEFVRLRDASAGLAESS